MATLNRPYRVLKEVTLTNAYVPTAGDNTLTVKVDSVPTRGIIRRIMMTLIDETRTTTVANSLDGFLITRTGDIAGNGVNSITSSIAQTAICQGPLDFQTSGTAGSLCGLADGTALFIDCFHLVPRYCGGQASVSPYQPLTGQTAAVATANDNSLVAGTVVTEVVRPSLAPFDGIYYDVSGDIKGPSDNTGDIFFHLLCTGSNMQIKCSTAAIVTLEIEPCF